MWGNERSRTLYCFELIIIFKWRCWIAAGDSSETTSHQNLHTVVGGSLRRIKYGQLQRQQHDSQKIVTTAGRKGRDEFDDDELAGNSTIRVVLRLNDDVDVGKPCVGEASEHQRLSATLSECSSPTPPPLPPPPSSELMNSLLLQQATSRLHTTSPRSIKVGVHSILTATSTLPYSGTRIHEDDYYLSPRLVSVHYTYTTSNPR